ncbi:MAG: hypothetical protein KAS66_12715 [Candidatus Omnitrophica bacterium]|nr:hypothetical protein [Candidatus Omnitrophota bacterium]
MNSGNQLLSFALVVCLTFLFFSTKKLVAEIKRAGWTIHHQREEILRLKWLIHTYQENARQGYDFHPDLFEDEPPADPLDWDNDPQF